MVTRADHLSRKRIEFMHYSIRSRQSIFRDIFTSYPYIIIAILGSIIYYFFFSYLISASSYGAFIFTVPSYLIYLLVISSGILLAVSAYILRRSTGRFGLGASNSTASALTTIIGGLIAGCGCSAPVLYSILSFLGITAADSFSISAFSIINSINQFQIPALFFLIGLNIFLIYYNLGKISQGIKRRVR